MGHVNGITDERSPKKQSYYELLTGIHCYGSQNKCFKDTMKTSIMSFDNGTERRLRPQRMA